MIPREIVPKIRSNGLYFRFQRCNLILAKKKNICNLIMDFILSELEEWFFQGVQL